MEIMIRKKRNSSLIPTLYPTTDQVRYKMDKSIQKLLIQREIPSIDACLIECLQCGIQEGIQVSLAEAESEAWMRGWVKGWIKGWIQGWIQGYMEGRQETAFNLITQTEMDDITISEVTGLPAESVARLRIQR
ncbi:hypothetical protein ABIE61_002333 [Marinobacterium sp. MBR-111]|jgi:hypothetical protein|uniref:hypothetical protein n=1 Tax=Marinobacterium sp. MBR-111 TaxID=3156463 RepID=UPI003395D936